MQHGTQHSCASSENRRARPSHQVREQESPVIQAEKPKISHLRYASLLASKRRFTVTMTTAFSLMTIPSMSSFAQQPYDLLRRPTFCHGRRSSACQHRNGRALMAVVDSSAVTVRRAFKTFKWKDYDINYRCVGPDAGDPVLLVRKLSSSAFCVAWKSFCAQETRKRLSLEHCGTFGAYEHTDTTAFLPIFFCTDTRVWVSHSMHLFWRGRIIASGLRLKWSLTSCCFIFPQMMFDCVNEVLL